MRAPVGMRIGLGNWGVQLEVEDAATSAEHLRFFAPFQQPEEVPSTGSLRIGVQEGFPVITAHLSGQQVYPERMLICGPEWQRIQRQEGSQPPRYFDRSIQGPPILEWNGDAMRVLIPELAELWTFLTFLWMGVQGGERVTLHAATCVVGRLPLIIIGASGAGKSTLSAALHLEGAQVLGDEAVLLDVRSLEFRAQHKPVAIRPGGAAALGLEMDSLPWIDTPKGEPKARMNNSVHPPLTTLAHPTLIFLQPRAQEPQLLPLGSARTVQHLLQVMGTDSGDLDHRLELAATLAGGSPSFAFSAGDPRASARLLIERFQG